MAERFIPHRPVRPPDLTRSFSYRNSSIVPEAKFTDNNDPFYFAFVVLGILSVGSVLYFMRSIRFRAILEKLLIIFFPFGAPPSLRPLATQTSTMSSS